MSDETVSFSLEVNVEQAYEDLRKLQTILFRLAGLLRRFGLPEALDQAILKIQRLIAWLNQLRLTLAALQTVSGPYGWAMLGISTLTTAVSFTDMLEGY